MKEHGDTSKSSAQARPLHPRLAQDCHVLGELPSSTLLLHRTMALHWFILVPRTDIIDLLDLDPALREALLDDAAVIAGYLKGVLGYPRVNIGALGLVVPQLHLHVVGRRPDDPCWPAPVWGNLPDAGAGSATYGEQDLATLRAALTGR